MPVTIYQKGKEDNIPLIEEYTSFQNQLPTRIKNANFISKINLGDKTNDGIHPNTEGQKIVAQNILKTINN